jgi:lysozyme family protein
MRKNFDLAVDFTLKWEGGYSYDRDDPGGETNFGISKKAYPELDIKNLKAEQARAIYFRDYWTAMGCDDLSYPLDIIAFDTAVNCGVSRTKKWLLNANTVALLMKRLEHYTYLVKLKPKMIKFYVGWVRRVLDLYATIVKGGM